MFGSEDLNCFICSIKDVAPRINNFLVAVANFPPIFETRFENSPAKKLLRRRILKIGNFCIFQFFAGEEASSPANFQIGFQI